MKKIASVALACVAASIAVSAASCWSDSSPVPAPDAGAPAASSSSPLHWELPGASPAPPRDPCATGITDRPATGKDDLVIRLERTRCYGKCPAYELSIYADGRAHLDPVWPSIDPPPDRRIPPEAVEKLRQRFRENGFFELCDTPRAVWTDYPDINLRFWDGTREKRVDTYLGNPIAQEIVRELAKRVDDAVDIESFLEEKPRPVFFGREAPPRPCSPCDEKDPLCDCPSGATGPQ